jgi:barbiturase
VTHVGAHKVMIGSVADASGLQAILDSGEVAADDVIAVIGKTEGNGGVNDYTRILADQAFRGVLGRAGSRSPKEIEAIPMVWSGGCDGVISPHATVFSRTRARPPGSSAAPSGRLAVGTAMSERILPEEIGRRPMVDKVAKAVGAAMADAEIDDPADVHWVQTKTPLLTMEGVAEALGRGREVTEDIHRSMDVSNGTSALGIAIALGEIDAGFPESAICRDLALYSTVASCSSGVELDRAQVIVIGNSRRASGSLRAGHSFMLDALDAAGVWRAVEDAAPSRTGPSETAVDPARTERVVNVFVKCEADPTGTLRGRRQVLLNDSDVHHHRQVKAAVGGVVAAAVGDPAVFVSVAAMHQGPPGGGPVMAIVDLSAEVGSEAAPVGSGAVTEGVTP